METIRELIIEHGASIEYVEEICTIRINENYPYKPIIEGILGNLRSLIIGQLYTDNYMILIRY